MVFGRGVSRIGVNTDPLPGGLSRPVHLSRRFLSSSSSSSSYSSWGGSVGPTGKKNSATRDRAIELSVPPVLPLHLFKKREDEKFFLEQK